MLLYLNAMVLPHFTVHYECSAHMFGCFKCLLCAKVMSLEDEKTAKIHRQFDVVDDVGEFVTEILLSLQ